MLRIGSTVCKWGQHAGVEEGCGPKVQEVVNIEGLWRVRSQHTGVEREKICWFG